MSNAVYPKYKEALLDGASNIDINDGTVKVALIDTGAYTYSGTHQFYSDLSGVVSTSSAVTSTTVTNGLFDADNVTFTAVTGNTVEALVIYIDTGTTTTSRLVAYMDSGISGLPATPNGGDISVVWNASGIFQL